MPVGEKVKAMFSGIAGRYDCANHLLSFGLDYYWRWRLLNKVEASKPAVVLDLATGSGDVAISLAKRLNRDVKIIGMDFCEPMLVKARQKALVAKFNIEFIVGDAQDIRLPDNSVDIVTIAFGFRNFENRKQALAEIYRVLKKPHGKLFILEFSQPYIVLRPFYYAYLKYLLPSVARLVTGDKTAYDYLVGSIETFPSRQKLRNELKESGYEWVDATALTGSVVAIHEARLQ